MVVTSEALGSCERLANGRYSAMRRPGVVSKGLNVYENLRPCGSPIIVLSSDSCADTQFQGVTRNPCMYSIVWISDGHRGYGIRL